MLVGLLYLDLSGSDFDFNVDAAGQFQLHQRIYRFAAGREDIDQALVRAELELLPALFVYVGRAQNRVLLLFRGQRNRTAYNSAGSFNRFHDFFGRLIDQGVVVAFQLDSDFLVHCWERPIASELTS